MPISIALQVCASVDVLDGYDGYATANIGRRFLSSGFDLDTNSCGVVKVLLIFVSSTLIKTQRLSIHYFYPPESFRSPDSQ